MISPSEGVDGELDLRMVIKYGCDVHRYDLIPDYRNRRYLAERALGDEVVRLVKSSSMTMEKL